jgi:hypothetical protein
VKWFWVGLFLEDAEIQGLDADIIAFCVGEDMPSNAGRLISAQDLAMHCLANGPNCPPAFFLTKDDKVVTLFSILLPIAMDYMD